MEPLTLFVKSLKSPYTQTNYMLWIRRYETFAGLDITQPPRVIQDSIISYILKLEEEGYAHGTRQLALSAIKHFFNMNDVVINWSKVNKFLGENKKTIEDRGYTRDEVKKILDKCDERKRVIILILASAGPRVGALVALRLRNLEKRDNIYKITFYEGSKERYVSFCTPECAAAIDSYLQYRKNYGEKLTPNSLLIRNQFDKKSEVDVSLAKPVHPNTIQIMIRELLFDTGLRDRPTEATAHQRKEVMAVHGFRKFFSTELNRATKNPLMVELLLGHDTGLQGVYNKPTDDDKQEFYESGMDSLTISDERRMKVEMQKKDKKIAYYEDIVEKRLAWVDDFAAKQGYPAKQP